MSEKCKICGGNDIGRKFKFWVAKEDAFGVFFFCIALAAPVGFLAFIWRIIEFNVPYFAAFVFFFIACFQKEHVKGFIFLCLAVFVPVEITAYIWGYLDEKIALPVGMASSYVAFIMAFYRIGNRVYAFFSLFVDYQFTIKSFCKHCNNVVRQVTYPDTSD